MGIRKVAFVLALICVAAVAGSLAYAMRHPAFAPVAPPDPASFDADLVERGRVLAGFGNCHVCHTAPGGKQFAGGLPLPTPFGIIYSTNLTPDPGTGIGSWSQAAFVRAMRQGVDRDGRYLYPAFPYDFFTRTTDDDLAAIYAYLMSQPALVAAARPNELRFPFNIRWLMAGWNALFLDEGPVAQVEGRDAELNRGAYLVEGLAHCGACHSARNRFGAASRDGSKAYAGGTPEGWYAPPLNGQTPAPLPWNADALVNYLIDGWDADHGIAAGPMTPVVTDLYDQSEDDVYAIAAYILSLGDQAPKDGAAAEALRARAEALEWGSAGAPELPTDPLMAKGAQVFGTQCAQCHKAGGQTAPLALSTAIHAPTSDNVRNIIEAGIVPPPGSPERGMPSRQLQVGADDMTALLAFLRGRFADKPAW